MSDPTPAYLDAVASRIDSEDPSVILWEVEEAFDELYRRDPSAFSPRMMELRELVRFSIHDALAPWLRDEREGVVRAARFAEKVGEAEVARILNEALAGRPQPKVRFSVTLPDMVKKILNVPTPDVCVFDGKDFGSTDIALSFAMDGFCLAVLRELVASRAEIPLEPPRKVRKRAAADEEIRGLTGAASAAELFGRLVGARNPRMAAGAWEDFEERRIEGASRIPVRHAAYPPPSRKLVDEMARRFGPAARDLLSVYAVHDGAELFLVDGEPGFCLAPIAQWPELLERAVEWAEGVTWQDEKDEIPKYLYSAIAFGMIPGDSERWLLVTEGPHAGKVMLSDTDLIEGEPRFDSFADFVSTLLVDAARVLNSGGHVRYAGKGGEEIFPIRYEFD